MFDFISRIVKYVLEFIDGLDLFGIQFSLYYEFISLLIILTSTSIFIEFVIVRKVISNSHFLTRFSLLRRLILLSLVIYSFVGIIDDVNELVDMGSPTISFLETNLGHLLLVVFLIYVELRLSRKRS